MGVESELKTGEVLAEALAAHLYRMSAARTSFQIGFKGGSYLIDIQLLPRRDPVAPLPPKFGQIDICSHCGFRIDFDGAIWSHSGPYKPGHKAVPTHPWDVS